MEKKEASKDIKLDLEVYNVESSTVMEEMEASLIASNITITRP
ncbi:hypothetical protein [Lentibacillus salicampi]|nr:hypothetical protein [Lentibacillus salicampi]